MLWILHVNAVDCCHLDVVGDDTTGGEGGIAAAAGKGGVLEGVGWGAEDFLVLVDQVQEGELLGGVG